MRALSEEMTLDRLLSVGRSLELSKQQAEEIEKTVPVDTWISMIQRRPTRKQMERSRKGSSINLLDEETFKSLKKRPMLTKEHNPIIPYARRPMNIRGIFSAEISGNDDTVSRTVYVTCEGKGNLLSYETAVFLGYVPEICEVNKKRHRRIPYHIREKVQEKLEKLKQVDIIEEVIDGPTPWVSPIVAQPKPKKPNELHAYQNICVKQIKRSDVYVM
ncbi:hypothetical protein LSH36_73g06005 [Paralvinella palmiformis]|uniref:Uncharacterized protein n=1 Tax=Paralvinella palmiformis TaxID=53620 RepID=A0AAD9K3H2_9ANNE|nr:hypothetical protein LSH36_73g06005 [Paralvinella palmiformis]